MAFDKLVSQNGLSSNTLIAEYIKRGQVHQALLLYQKMSKNEPLHYSSRTHVALLKACAKLKDLHTGTELHARVAKLGLLGRDAFIADTLIDMYVKCGSLARAHCVLNSLPTRDVVAWTALIAGYSEHGLLEEALKCFYTMQHDGVIPDRVVFVCILRACGRFGAMDNVQAIHIQIERMGLLERDVAVGTILVEIYATCGSLSRAQQVFDKLVNRDVIAWTALISGYAEHGYGKEALRCFDQMQCDGVFPDSVTFMCSLKACGSLRAVDKVQEIHLQIESAGFLRRDDIAGTVLVDVYTKCGALDKGLQVFNNLRVRDVVAWTVLIEGYAEHGHGEEALKWFEQMQTEGVPPNAITFSCSLKACGIVGAAIQGRKVHAQVERTGFLTENLIVGNALIDMYAKCGLLAKAQEVFNKLPLRNVVSWTSLIAGYAEHDHGETALNCFAQMQLEGVSPNVVTFICCLKACGSIGATDKGEEMHAQIESEGFLEEDATVGNTLVDMYARCGMFAKAQQVIDKLPNQNVVTWTSLIARFTEHGHAEEALKCFDKMRRKGFCPNEVTFVAILKVWGSIGAIDKVQELHAEIERKGLWPRDLVGNMLVFTYSKCGVLTLAQEVFDKLPVRDVVSWNSLIVGFTQFGETENVFSMFERMLGEGIRPDPITFTIVLSACNRQGLLNRSQTYFQAMSKEYGIVSAPEHHSGLLDVLCRFGEFDKAKALIEGLSCDSNVAIWHSVLSASKNFHNAELGKWAFDRAMRLNEKDAASYDLLSHIYRP